MIFKTEKNSPPGKYSREDFYKSLHFLMTMLGLTLAAFIVSRLAPEVGEDTPFGFAALGVVLTVAQVVKRYAADNSDTCDR
jgi:hypothetical protein